MNAKVLIVDDEPFNVDYLEQELEDLEYDTCSASNGLEALEQVSAEAPDVVLLDIMMPEMDGFEVLERLKAEKKTKDIPVIIISAMDDLGSITRGIELGAEDYLPKPFEPSLLEARLRASLEKKRLRDQEVEYLAQVEQIAAAAQALENKSYTPEQLAGVAARGDSLGHLARTFQNMAREIHAREQRLLHKLEQIKIDREERAQAAQETVAVYVPIDRQWALLRQSKLPTHTQGAVIFADISGFTPLTEALARELGLMRGAEELIRQLNRVYEALLEEVHRYAGSVINFSGDAITCWFDHEPGFEAPDASRRAVTCALQMQARMREFATLTTSAGSQITLALKTAIVAGQARRFLVGDPQTQLVEVLAGRLLDVMASGESMAHAGETLLHAEMLEGLQDIEAVEWRQSAQHRFARILDWNGKIEPSPWPKLPPESLPEDLLRPWLLKTVYERVCGGKSSFLSELRTASALFLQFEGIDYDQDPDAEQKLDQFTRWVQQILTRHDGFMLQLMVGDKGSYLYAVFGAPVSLSDDAVQAVKAAMELLFLPPQLSFIKRLQIGLARGQMRTGPYGGYRRRTYGAVGDKTNVAARLMSQAQGSLLCDLSIAHAAQSQLHFEALAPLQLKGKSKPTPVFRPIAPPQAHTTTQLIDSLPPGPQLALKLASLIGERFDIRLLEVLYPVNEEKTQIPLYLGQMIEDNILARCPVEPKYHYLFKDHSLRNTAYDRILFSQKRQLHSTIAQWLEAHQPDPTAGALAEIASHWERAEEQGKAIHCLERASEEARKEGNHALAQRHLERALELEKKPSVLSGDYPSFQMPKE